MAEAEAVAGAAEVERAAAAGGAGGASSFRIVPRPSPSAIVAWTGFVRFTKKVSSPSKKLSPKTGTVSVTVDSPGSKVSVPLPAW